ncbi:MAG TPA: CoA pyrophosphatase [Oligoflexus sp.]|uniref:NUDIX hydrolase n=1 Tax=Oligoflexus sp. TaxID=1971216 RepID=UPI002D6614DA|nr:CoA pyrophosphatase [Oligoflexus sp.]HYX34157.1 CoA pyrophosphatase [Oligoflexus sp.]
MTSAVMMPRLRHLEPVLDHWPAVMHSRASAVLMLFIPDRDPGAPARIVFTRRSTLVRTHKGQIGFPGGRREATDASPVVTALRETHEEIGLPPGAVEVLGMLPPLPSLDRRSVIPIVGFSQVDLATLAANADEVAELFALPWPSFTPEVMQNLRFNVFGCWRETPYFPASGYHVWGLTAWMLKTAALYS